MTTRRPYPSDISDARWALIEPTLTAWRQARIDRRPTGEPAHTDLREVFNALLHINRTGISWRYIPDDLPPKGTAYYYYAAWRDEGILAQLNIELTGLARIREGRVAEPTAAIIDTDAEVVTRSPEARGFHVLKRRNPPASSEAMIHLAMIDNVSKRITGETTPTWRGTYQRKQYKQNAL